MTESESPLEWVKVRRPAPTDRAVDTIGTIGEVSCEIGITDTPWRLPIDAIVLSVGGELDGSVRQVFPGADWETIEFLRITPTSPRVLPLPRISKSGLALAVLATPHEDGETDLPTLRSVAAATEHAISMAAQAGVTAIGLPLLATGALGFPVAEVASVAIPAVKRALRSKEYPAPESLVFICIDTTTAVAVRDAWNAPPSIDERTAAEQAPAPEPAGAKSAPPPQEFSDTELAGGLSSDLVKPNEGIPLARDNLGFAPYVSMLATVIADRQTPLPLSVGIFGEWGSGKSFFMGLLRNQVRALTESGSPAYCRRIDQIGFNAWHYADTNLWASLGDEIFRQLAEPGPGVEMRRERLRVELAERLVERRQLEAATRQARVEAAALQASVDAAAASRESGARELIVALKRSDTAGKMLNQLWRRLGVADEIEQGKRSCSVLVV
jgi:hypothetical protein